MSSIHNESVSAILSHLLQESDLQALVVNFPAGVGKTQVMNEVIKRLKSRGLRVRLVGRNLNECDKDVDFMFAESHAESLKILKNSQFTIRGSA